MKTMNVSWTRAMILGCAMLLLPGCDSSKEPMGMGEVEFQITDAPSDDASIQSVFVTVTDIKVDGQSIGGFTRTTFDLKAYREGNVKVLGTSKLVAKAYSNITLVLDADTDVNGAAPGCYVLADNNSKFKLRSGGTIDVVVNKSWNVMTNGTSALVLDFDLRKAIRTMDDQAIRYNFVSNDNLQAAVRLVAKEKVGTLSGTYSEQASSNADVIVAYAYKKGSYNANVETAAQGDDAIQFKNAVSSATVKSDLGHAFKLAFLEEGDYEIHFAAYHRDAASGRLTLQSMLKSETTAGGSLGDFVTVQAGVTLTVSTVITGTL